MGVFVEARHEAVKGQLDPSAAAVARIARADLAPVGLGARTDDRQSESRPSALAAAGRIGAMEPLKDALALLRWDSRTVVQHRKADPIRRRALHLQAHEPRRLARVLDRVAGQVAERLRQSIRIGMELAAGDRSELEAAL